MKNKFEEWKKDPKGKSKIQFSGYMIFFLFIIALVVITGNYKAEDIAIINDEKQSPKEETNETPTSYLEKEQLLINGEYDYTFTITGEEKIIFTGECRDKIRTGFKQSEDGIIKYRENKDDVVLLNVKGEESYSGLYDNLDRKLFDFDNLFNLLNRENATIDKTTNSIIYTYHLEEYDYIVKTGTKTIDEIDISKDNIEYIFTFTYRQ